MNWDPITFAGILHTTPRVGQNAVLRSLRTVAPGADEWGAAQPLNGLLVASINRPPPSNAWDHLDTSNTRWGFPVWMRRRDIVDQAISWAIAAQTGQFRSDVAARGIPEYSAEAIRKGLATIVDQEARWAAHFETVAVRPLMIWYEDDVAADPRNAARKILAWWNLEGEPQEPDLRRINRDIAIEWRDRWDNGEVGIPAPE